MLTGAGPEVQNCNECRACTGNRKKLRRGKEKTSSYGVIFERVGLWFRTWNRLVYVSEWIDGV